MEVTTGVAVFCGPRTGGTGVLAMWTMFSEQRRTHGRHAYAINLSMFISPQLAQLRHYPLPRPTLGADRRHQRTVRVGLAVLIAL